MMMEEQLSGSWDQPTRTIVMHSTCATRMQTLATAFADKASNLVDLNERALTLRTGGLRDEGGDEGGRGYDQGGFQGGRRCDPFLIVPHMTDLLLWTSTLSLSPHALSLPWETAAKRCWE
jgi:hypothetical protein